MLKIRVTVIFRLQLDGWRVRILATLATPEAEESPAFSECWNWLGQVR